MIDDQFKILHFYYRDVNFSQKFFASPKCYREKDSKIQNRDYGIKSIVVERKLHGSLFKCAKINNYLNFYFF